MGILFHKKLFGNQSMFQKNTIRGAVIPQTESGDTNKWCFLNKNRKIKSFENVAPPGVISDFYSNPKYRVVHGLLDRRCTANTTLCELNIRRKCISMNWSSHVQ